MVVAIPLTETQQTLGRLVLIEVLVTVVVLAGLAALAWWLVQARPAAARGHGRRRRERSPPATSPAACEPAEPRTEVGRLGLVAQRDARADRAGVRRAQRVARRSCAASSPTPRTSCARRSRRSAATPRCSDAAPRTTPRTSPRRCAASRTRAGAWACWSTSCCCSRASARGASRSASPVDLARVAGDGVTDARAVDPGPRDHAGGPPARSS